MINKPPFSVIAQVKNLSDFTIDKDSTQHFNSNLERLGKYLGYLNSTPINGFIVQRKDGIDLEVHILLENGIILIFGLNNRKLITTINPQCYQVTRYFEGLNIPMEPRDYIAMKNAVYRNDVLGWKEDNRNEY